MIIKNCNFKSNVKKILKFLYNILAWGPAIIVISSLVSIFLILPFTLLPVKEVKIFNEKSLPFFILEFIVLTLMSYYGYRIYSKIKNNKIAVFLYCLVLILSIALVFCYRYRFVILLQPALPLVYAIIFEEKLFKIRDFFSTSKVMLASLNIFDVCYIFALQWVIPLDISPEWLSWGIVLFITIICPALRTGLLNFYTKQSKKRKNRDKTYFSSYVVMYIISFVQLFLYLTTTLNYLKLQDKSIVDLAPVNMMFATLFIYFWFVLKTQLDKGGYDKKNELLRWVFGVLYVLLIFFYDRIEGGFLIILTWLLPVLISTIIGKLHYQFATDDSSQLPIPTLKMKKHIYWLHLISFLTLFCLNLFSALFTVQKIKLDEIIPVNTAKFSIINLINPSNKELASVWMSSIITSFIIVSLSIILATALSVGVVKFLKLNYSDSAKGYYEYRNNGFSALINRRYKRNIRKRRKNNV
ncbi:MULTISPECIES: hypothetical protein [unclassified Streptococcus]|uniref:hypothetical protein n=1 Tax=unclassified Streptococcus TaxID=2608887 RepID=UPI00088A73F1|nr:MULTISPECIES: hypothetical protein [unclassified Streptococcus]NMD84821.1 hypothetical protein [Streptococcus sp. WB01_FAA12]SDP33053.1 hypothetical protein SAMN05216494_0940 [Streptococcus sp. NLAE-zl-C503]